MSGEITLFDDDAAEQPGDVISGEIHHRLQALLVCNAGDRFIHRSGFDLARSDGPNAPCSTTIFFQDHIAAAQSQFLQSERDSGIAFRTECTHGDHSALQVGGGFHAGIYEKGEADFVAQ